MHILVTGGAGYIGSHIVALLGDVTRHKITIIDNLSTGSKGALLYGDLIEADLSDFKKIDSIFNANKFDAVIHLAASIIVPESVKKPLKYYLNNTVNTVNLVNLCIKYNVNKFIFSSTAAVYGEAEEVPVKETFKTLPTNPYGMSKLMSEQVIRDAGTANDSFKYVILRYFNVAGADVKGRIGQTFPCATHLLKVCAEAAVGKREKVQVYGEDFDTEDGTGIRDYIHVSDLACAHIEALNYLDRNNSATFNCGYGIGYSVKEVIKIIKKITKVDFPVEVTSRRSGDVAIMVADNSKILKETQWKPKYNDLELICKTTLDWEKSTLLI